MTDQNTLRQKAIAVVADYMGAAAEFVVDDAMGDAAKAAGNLSGEGLAPFFFAALAKQLPPELPYIKIKEAIAKAAGIRI